MAIELDITKELATISATLAEVNAIAAIVNGQIARDSDFGQGFNTMIGHIAKSYDVVIANLHPLSHLASEDEFTKHFDSRHAVYTACYLLEISKPRRYADDAYEEYLLLKTQKEFNTGFPLLKRTFTRLDGFMDKWITNDAWLAMGIDILFKRLQSLLNEIAALKKKDAEDAYILYNSTFSSLHDYLAQIALKRDLLWTGAEPVIRREGETAENGVARIGQ